MQLDFFTSLFKTNKKPEEITKSTIPQVKKTVVNAKPKLSKEESARLIFAKYIPELAVEDILEYFLTKKDLSFKVTNKRITKLGDFRYDYATKHSTITVNCDLNQYNFLITLLHEMAHYECWKSHKKTVKPHGEEWKHHYRLVAIPFLKTEIFPPEILETFTEYLQNPSASTCGDFDLMRKLKEHNLEKNDNKILLENLAVNSVFKINNKVMVKMEQRRKRFLCKDKTSGKLYLVSGIAEVEKVF
jgi:SprT protein